MKNSTLLLVTLLLLLYACQDKQATTPASQNGVWEQMGYGKIFEIDNDSVRIFDVSNAGCVANDLVPLASKGVVASVTDDSLTIKKNIKTYKFARLKSLPTSCSQPHPDADDPIYNFDVLWSTFNEQYSFFDKRDIDWNKAYDTYKEKITAQTSELELFQIFDELLESLDDGHVSLDTPDNLIEDLRRIKSDLNEPDKEKPRIDQFSLANKIADRYCKTYKKHNAGIVNWGMMKNDIAYVQINMMLFLAYYDVPQDLPLMEFIPRYGEIMDTRVFQRQDEIDGADVLMDTIIQDLKNATAMIIDLRFNPGGKDEAGLEFLGHLFNERVKVSTKKARRGKGFANHQSIYMEPRTPHFGKDVYILTSHQTGSAAELATMSTLSSDRFTRVGSNTEGIFSDGLDKQLPNGWTYTLSNELYYDYQGINYEGVGIPPDIKIDYPQDKGAMLNALLDQVEGDGDKAIEQVIELEQEKGL